MDQDITVNKLLLNINEFHVDVRTALAQAYAAGYDKRGMDLNSHKTRKIEKISISGKSIKIYDSISQAASMNKLSRDFVSETLRGKRKMSIRKEYYFRYVDIKEDHGGN